MTPVRILYLMTDGFGAFGGIAQYNRDMLQALDASADVREIVALPRTVSEDPGALPDKVVHDLSGLGGIGAFARAALRRGLTGAAPDVVICAHINLLPVAWAIARARRARLILLVYGIDVWQPTGSRLANWCASRVDLVPSISRVTLEKMRGWCPVPEDRAAILPNAIRLEAYGMTGRTDDLARAYGVEGRRVVMTMGRLETTERMKGFDEMIDAMPELRARHPDLTYLIAGDGSDRSRLERKAADLGVGDVVRFVGRVAEDRKPDHYRLADVFAMPSRGEGFGFVFIEALACGVPVVAGRNDGGYEAIMDGALGLAVDPSDRAAIVAAVSRQLSSPKHIPAALAYFDFTAFAGRAHDMIRRVMGRS